MIPEIGYAATVAGLVLALYGSVAAAAEPPITGRCRPGCESNGGLAEHRNIVRDRRPA